MKVGISEVPPSERKRLPAYWWLGLLVVLDGVIFWFGFTEDAVTVGTTLQKELFGFAIRVVDERQTFSIVSAIFRLKDDGNLFLFGVIFLFSVLFPVLKLIANFLIWLIIVGRNRDAARPWISVVARLLHGLGRWSMLEVFVAGLLCVLLKLGDVTRFKVEPGMYWFFGAVLLSMVNALATERAVQNKSSLQTTRSN